MLHAERNRAKRSCGLTLRHMAADGNPDALVDILGHMIKLTKLFGGLGKSRKAP